MRNHNNVIFSNLERTMVFLLTLLLVASVGLIHPSLSSNSVIDGGEVLFNGFYSQSPSTVTVNIYISTSNQVTGTLQGYTWTSSAHTDYVFVDMPDSSVRYGNLTSTGYLVGQFTCASQPDPSLGALYPYYLDSYFASHGATTYYIAVKNTGPDISFRASILLHFSNGTQVNYPFVSTLSYGETGYSVNRGFAGNAAEITLAPIDDQLLSNYNNLQSQYSQLQSNYNQLQSNYSQLQSNQQTTNYLLVTTLVLIVILASSTGYFLMKSRRKP